MQKPIIEVKIFYPELKKYLRYEDWDKTREYLQVFLDDALLNIKVEMEQGKVLNDVIVFTDKHRIR